MGKRLKLLSLLHHSLGMATFSSDGICSTIFAAPPLLFFIKPGELGLGDDIGSFMNNV